MQEQRLNDEVFAALATRGYVIVHNYLPEAQRSAMAAALRRILKPWDEIADNPPDDRIGSCYFPYPEQCLNRAIVDREAIDFARRWLGTDQIHYRPGLGLISYPGRKGGRSTLTMATTRCCRPLNPTVATASSTSGSASKMSTRIRPRPSSSPTGMASIRTRPELSQWSLLAAR